MSLETMTKLQTVSVGVGGTSSIDFTNIPQTFTDLVICLSIRDNGTGTSGASYIDLQLNNSTGTYTVSRLLGAGSASVSNSAQTSNFMSIGYMGNSRTSMTSAFTNAEIYIPNYSGFNEKTVSCNYSMPDSSTGAYSGFGAGRWNQSQPITSIKIKSDGQDITQHSTAILYGVKNARQTAGNSIKATGGNIVFDGTYVYHVYPSSGTFTPTQPILANVLVVAGGGGGAPSTNWNGFGGGGAGGLLIHSSKYLSPGNTYSCTVGSGGASNSVGSNSLFADLITYGGGTPNSSAGGSGAGGSGRDTTPPPGGASTQTSNGGGVGYGNAGGAGHGGDTGTPYYNAGGGGGGAGGAGQNSDVRGTLSGGHGGVGLTNEFINAIGVATGAGQYVSGNYYFAGGAGGAGSNGSASAGIGGYGGGGNSDYATGVGSGAVAAKTAGLANTGGGGGSANNSAGGDSNGKPGGSGIVIIRYKG